MRLALCVIFFFLFVSNPIKSQVSVQANFIAPDTVCVNTPFTISNSSTGASSYYWNFCVADINTPPIGENLGNIGGAFRLPVFTDQVFFKGNYYVFVCNNYPGGLVRLDFGNSMLNTPTEVDLGDVGGVIPNNLEGIQVVNDNGKWYALLVAGYPAGGVASRIIKIEFDADITNTNPVATDWGNIGNMDYPIDLHVFNEGGNWYGFTVNSVNNTFTRFNFGSNFDTPPTAVNMGNIGNLANPTGIYAIKEGSNWYVFLTNNSDNSSIARLDFGTSLLNTPTAVNLGNINNTLYRPRDIYLMKYCGKTVGYVVNGLSGQESIVQLDFDKGLTGMPTAKSLGDIGNLSFPHSISKFFRVGNDVYSFITNVNSNTITRLKFSGCTNSSIPNSNLKTPPAISYSTPGTYNINLTVDDGLPTQTTFCKTVVALDCKKPVIPDFTIPDTVCVNTPVTIMNKTVGASTNYWNFCVAGLNDPPAGTNLGNLGGVFSLPVFMDYSYDNGNYYGFVVNYSPGGLTRLDFGNSLLNTPTVTSLGNFGGVLTIGEGTEGIQVVKNEGKWYAIIVGGNTTTQSAPRVVKIEFGASLSNPSPAATNWGNIGNMDQPIDLHVFKEGANWYGFTVSAENNSITRFNFTSSFDNTPTAVNLGNLGNLAYPTGIYAINDNGFWRVFIVNGGNRFQNGLNSSLTRLDFGSSLLNNPAATNLGNPGNELKHPRDISILKSCGEIVAFVVNGKIGSDEIIKLNFNNNLTSVPSAVNLGNEGNINFPHSISKLFRVNNDLFAFITNVTNNTLTRLRFTGCSNAAIPNSNLKDPPPIVYNQPGTYNINLTIDDGLPTQASICKQVVVMPSPLIDFSFQPDDCNPLKIKFSGSVPGPKVKWDFGDGNTSSGQQITDHIFAKAGIYQVKFFYNDFCAAVISKNITINLVMSNIIKTNDTAVCENGFVKMEADAAVSYCWSPSTYLSNASIANPIAKPLSDVTYYLTSKLVGSNLIKNGSFSAGNIDFSSSYAYIGVNTTEGEYFVGQNSQQWNGAFSVCGDHTDGTGNMMLVNGSSGEDLVVWRQTVSVSPNTSYEFSTWIQSVYPVNPANLQFSINGNILGGNIMASLPTCTWNRFNTNWNSGNNTTAIISIVNKNTATQGNDFALDDISFAPITYKSDSVVITIDKPKIKAGNDTALCAGASMQLNATGATTYSWSPATGLNNNGIANPIASIKDTATRYIVSGTNQNGCIAKDTVQISILPKPLTSISNDTSICGNGKVQLQAFGGIKYQWSPSSDLNNASVSNPIASLSASTKYHVTVTGSNGCTNKDSVTINVLPPFVFNVSNDTSVCTNTNVQLLASGGVNYQWSPSASLNNSAGANPVATPPVTTTYKVIATNASKCTATDSVIITTLAPPAVVVSKDTSICKQGTAYLKAGGGVLYTWFPAAGLDNTLSSTPMASPASSTFYKVEVTGANTCKAVDSVYVNILPSPSIQLSNDTAICGVGNAQLIASGGAAYVWTPATGLSNNLLPNPLASPTLTTTYKVLVTGSNTCTSKDSVTIKILPPLVTSISKDTSICGPKQVALFASGGTIYQWTPSTGLNNASVANPVANPLANTVYSVKITSADNCNVTRSVAIDLLRLPTISLSNDTVLCRPGNVQLMASGGISYQWFPSTGLSNSLSSNPVATLASSTTYKVVVTGANNCSNSDSVALSIKPAPQFGISTTGPSGCAGTAIPLIAYGGDKYEWSPANGLSNAFIANPVATLQNNQVYTVKITETTCKEQATFTVPVTIKTLPLVVVTKSNDISCNKPFAQLNTNSAGDSYVWTPAGGLSNNNVSNPIASPSVTTSYTVSILDATGCKSSGSIEVKVLNNSDFRLYQMPTAFTPGHDSKNDCFGVWKWGNVSILSFEIYNRWGQVVFKGNNGRPCWDGTFNGTAQPSGNFVYNIKVETICGIVERKGNVVLIR
jgi:gliding motility-associated-like protein